MSTSIFSLSIHAGYGCRERGACCTAGWPISIEGSQLDPLAHGAVLATREGACVFYQRNGQRRCEIHRTMGHAALPLACRQFPRVSVQDPRGTSITLSHYCPTAADMLASAALPMILENDATFPRGGEYVGLDARASLPPLLRPDMLMDWDAWWQWECLTVATIASAKSADAALTHLRAVVEEVRTWRPTDGPLTERVTDAFHRADSEPARRDGPSEDELVACVVESAGEHARSAGRDPRHREAPPTHPTPAHVHRHFLAAHAFANWTAHLGRGLRTWLASIQAADALVRRGLTIGEADLWLRHLADPWELAGRLGGWEEM